MGKMKLTVATACALLALTVGARADRTPDVPANIAVPDGNKVEFHAYAIGVQIYVCTQSTTDPTKFSWVFKAPQAVLYDAFNQTEPQVVFPAPGASATISAAGPLTRIRWRRVSPSAESVA